MKTTQLYLEDSYIKEMDATILEVIPEGEKRWRVLLDKTVFYPMGGGQPTDQGVLTNNEWTGNVYQVMMKDGEVWHYMECPIEPIVGTQIHGVINWDRRFKNMRVHSAGHVVDFALYQLGYSPQQLVPTKGDHGKKPFILYTGTLGKDITKELDEKSNELIQKGLVFTTKIVPFETLEKEALYLQPGLPTNKSLRMLTLEGVGSVADGGTQVKNTSEVGKIAIASCVEKEGATIITYNV